jgi:hypothetical protein
MIPAVAKAARHSGRPSCTPESPNGEIAAPGAVSSSVFVNNQRVNCIRLVREPVTSK